MALHGRDDQEAAAAAKTTTTGGSGGTSGRPAPRSPARSKRRAQPKLSPSRASANQKASAKRLSQPSNRPSAADVADPTHASAQNQKTFGNSAPRQKAVPSERRSANSTVDWDSLLVQSDVEILGVVADTSSKGKSNFLSASYLLRTCVLPSAQVTLLMCWSRQERQEGQKKQEGQKEGK